MIVEFEGQQHEFPNDFTDDEVRGALQSYVPRQPKLLSDAEMFGGAQAAPQTKLLSDAEMFGGAPPAPPPAQNSRIPESALQPVAETLPQTMWGTNVPMPAGISGRGLQIGAQGAARAVADTVGLLPDLANMGANAGLAVVDKASRTVGGPEIGFRFPMASDEIAKTSAQVAEKVGIPVVNEQDMSGSEKLGYNINRYGTQGALTGGLLSTLAAARASVPVARATPQIGDSFLRPYSASAGQAVIGDTVAGAGAGTAVTASEALPPNIRTAGGGSVGAGADLLAMLAGGVAGGTIAGAGMRGPGFVKDRLTGSFPAHEVPLDPQTGLPTSNRIADRAADFAQSQAIDPTSAAEKIRTGANSARETGAPMPTAGLMSEDPKLSALERGIRQREPGDFAARDIALRDTARDTIEGIQPQNVNPRDATEFVQGEVSRRMTAVGNELTNARQRHEAADAADRGVADVIRSYGGRGGQASADLDRIVAERALVPAQNEKNTRYRAIDPDRTVMRDIEPMARLADDIERQVQEIPPSLVRDMVPQRLMDDLRAMRARVEVDPATGAAVNVGGPGQMSFGAMNEMRSGLASASLAARTSGQTLLAENLDRFRAMIGEEGRRLAADGSPAGARAQAAAQFYRDDFAPVWNRGPGDEATRFRKDFNVDRTNRTTTPPTTTAGRFLTTAPGSSEKAESLGRIINSLPDPNDQRAAIDAVRRFVLDDMSRTVGLDGRVHPQNLARWLNGKGGWDDALTQFPTVRTEMFQVLSDVRAGNAARNTSVIEVERAAAILKRTQQDIDNSALSLVLGREPTKAARAVLESKDPMMAMREIRGTIGQNTKARDAWERAVTDHLVDRITKVDPAAVSTGNRALDYGKLVNTFGRYEQALAELYAGQPEKMNALRRAQKMLEPLARIPGPASRTVPDAGHNEEAWRAMEIGLKGFYGVLKGGGVLRTLRIALKGDGDAAQIERLVSRMMFDPELAAHLLTRKTQDVGSPAWNNRLAVLLRRVEAGRSVWGDDQD